MILRLKGSSKNFRIKSFFFPFSFFGLFINLLGDQNLKGNKARESTRTISCQKVRGELG